MPYHREDDGLPITTITCALVFIYKTTTHTFTHFVLYNMCPWNHAST